MHQTVLEPNLDIQGLVRKAMEQVHWLRKSLYASRFEACRIHSQTDGVPISFWNVDNLDKKEAKTTKEEEDFRMLLQDRSDLSEEIYYVNRGALEMQTTLQSLTTDAAAGTYADLPEKEQLHRIFQNMMKTLYNPAQESSYNWVHNACEMEANKGANKGALQFFSGDLRQSFKDDSVPSDASEAEIGEMIKANKESKTFTVFPVGQLIDTAKEWAIENLPTFQVLTFKVCGTPMQAPQTIPAEKRAHLNKLARCNMETLQLQMERLDKEVNEVSLQKQIQHDAYWAASGAFMQQGIKGQLTEEHVKAINAYEEAEKALTREKMEARQAAEFLITLLVDVADINKDENIDGDVKAELHREGKIPQAIAKLDPAIFKKLEIEQPGACGDTAACLSVCAEYEGGVPDCGHEFLHRLRTRLAA